MTGALAAALALLLAPPPAAAPATPAELRAQQPIEELAADLAYGFCPLLLVGELKLDNSQLTEHGFGTKVEKLTDPRFGELSFLGAKRPDGEIAFGGAAGKACSVVVQGPKLPAVMARLKSAMVLTGLRFAATANLTPAPPGVAVETFRAAVDKQFLYLQLIDAGGPKPAVLAQLFVMDK